MARTDGAPRTMSDGDRKTGSKTLPTLDVQPKETLADEPIQIVATGCRPGAVVEMRAQRRDGAGVVWTSRATFRADEDGVVDTTRHPPTSGDYAGVDPYGLLWSLRPPEGREPFSGGERLYVDTHFQLVVDDEAPAAAGGRTKAAVKAGAGGRQTASVRHRFLAPGVERQPVEASGLRGVFFAPEGGDSLPTILVLGGSEGGMPEATAALLASHGFAALALAYFGVEGLPPILAEIPLEYFETALDWLAARPEADPERIGVMGGSKGGELALLLAATFPQLRAVVADAASGVVWQGFDYASRPPRSSWTFRGEPLPCVPFSFGLKALGALLAQRLFHKPAESFSTFSQFARDPEIMEAATIPVERINGPVLLFSGGDDRMWPAVSLTEVAVKRLQRGGFAHPYEHISYPDAGHAVLGIPGTPTFATDVTSRFVFGGTAPANARAHIDGWPRVLTFFRSAFGESTLQNPANVVQ